VFDAENLLAIPCVKLVQRLGTLSLGEIAAVIK